MPTLDFEAAVSVPFRMQPGLRRLPAGAAHLTPLASGSRHQREKLAVLSAFWPQALCAAPGFDAGPAVAALFAHAAREQPQAWCWDGCCAQAPVLGVAVRAGGDVVAVSRGRFGLGDEVSRCVASLPLTWRQVGLFALAFAEDIAVVDGRSGTLPWLAVALPSHWAPENQAGRRFDEVHAAVADNAALLKAAPALLHAVTGGERWERWVWNVTDHPRLHAHPARVALPRWQQTTVDGAWLRSERQTFIAVGGRSAQAVFTIRVDVQRLADVATTPAHARALHDAVASMSPAVLAYRNLAAVRGPLLEWLARRSGSPR